MPPERPASSPLAAASIGSKIPGGGPAVRASIGVHDELALESVMRICRSSEPFEVARRRFRDLAMRIDSILGVGHAFYDGADWSTLDTDWSGVTLDEESYQGKIGDVFSASYQRNAVLQLKHSLVDCEVMLYVAPVHVVGADAELIILVTDFSANDMALRRCAEQLAFGVQFCKQSVAARSNDWKIASLSAIIDLTDRIESSDSFGDACKILVNETSHYIGGPLVAFGWFHGSKLKVRAVSGESAIDPNSKLVGLFQQCLAESVTRASVGKWSVKNDSSDEPLLLLHKTLAHQLEVECVVSIPICRMDGTIIGSWLFAGQDSLLNNERFERLLDVVTPRIGSAMVLSQMSDPQGIRRFTHRTRNAMKGKRVPLIALSVMGLAAIMAIPVPYQVRASVEAKPNWRRFVVAPFDGQIEQAMVRVGDDVIEGQTLAKMDGRELRWQLLSTAAEKEQSVRKREVELASRNAAEALLAEQQLTQILAEETLIRHKLSQLEIKAPANGKVLSGSNERAEAVSVVVGQPIFEIGSLQNVRIEIYIPSDDISMVDPGSRVRIWLEGLEDQVILAEIHRIRPSSEERLSKNVFVAEVEIENSSLVVRPGMGGTAKIECKKMPLGWNLFHKPVQYLRSNYTF